MPNRAKPKLPREQVTKTLDSNVERSAVDALLAKQHENRRIKEELAGRSAGIYHDAPALFVNECFIWPEDEKPTPYQLKNLQRLAHAKRLAVRGPHGLGKTAQNSWVLLWFALTRDAAGEDWKCITTASAWRQLTHFLWPEVRKWAMRLDWARLGREPFSREELFRMELRLKHGSAFAVACEDPATIEGAHADQMLYIYDEAKTIPGSTFDASEGAFAGAGADTKMEGYALASSTPGEPSGRFYDIHSRAEGFDDWHVVHVTLDDAMKAERISADWKRERERQWGANSAVFINRVLGEFATSEEDGVIPLRAIEAANERWREQQADWSPIASLTHVGADIARSGKDKTVLAMRYGDIIRELRRFPMAETMEATGQIQAALRAGPPSLRRPHPIVDVIGIGAGVVDRLRELGVIVTAYNGAERSVYMDASGELGFVNLRSAAWWHLRELLIDPDSQVALPPDDELTGDLVAPKWKVTSGGRIQVEPKEELIKRIGRSPDVGDAVVMAFATDMGPSVSAPIFGTGPSRWSPSGQRLSQ